MPSRSTRSMTERLTRIDLSGPDILSQPNCQANCSGLSPSNRMAPRSKGAISKITSSSCLAKASRPRVELMALLILNNTARSRAVRATPGRGRASAGSTYRASSLRSMAVEPRTSCPSPICKVLERDDSSSGQWAKSSKEFPILISSPSSRTLSCTGRPLTMVPLRLSRSMILNRSASLLMRQCRRDSEESGMAIELDGSRPRETSPSVSEKVAPLRGPEMASSREFMVDAS